MYLGFGSNGKYNLKCEKLMQCELSLAGIFHLDETRAYLYMSLCFSVIHYAPYMAYYVYT